MDENNEGLSGLPDTPDSNILGQSVLSRRGFLTQHRFFISVLNRGLQAQCKGIRAWPKEIGSGPILVGVRGFKSLPLHHSFLIFRSFCSFTSGCVYDSDLEEVVEEVFRSETHQDACRGYHDQYPRHDGPDPILLGQEGYERHDHSKERRDDQHEHPGIEDGAGGGSWAVELVRE